MTGSSAPLILLAGTTVMTAAAALYGRYVRMPRPAAGRFTSSDVVIMTVLLIALPFGYVHLPIPVLLAIFGVLFLAAVQAALAPLLGGRRAMLLAVAACGLVLALGLSHHPLMLMWGNDLLIAVAVIGVVNLWVQTGMTAAQVAALSAVLAVYDLLATGATSLTATFFGRISGHPFAPALSGSHGAAPVALGLGDCLMIALWPLAVAKAYGRIPGWIGAIAGLAVVAVIEAGAAAGWLTGTVPVLTILGPVVIAQWAFWRIRGGAERTTGGWQSGASPGPAVTSGLPPLVDAALLAAQGSLPQRPNGLWLAFHDGAALGQGITPGLARRSAREAGCPGVPVIVQASPALTGNPTASPPALPD